MISSEIFGSISKIQDLFIAQIYPQFQDFEASFYSSRMSPNVVEVLFYAYNKHFIHFWSGIFTQILSFILQNIHSNIVLHFTEYSMIQDLFYKTFTRIS